MNAQSNSEISNVYINRAQKLVEKIEFKQALIEFNKAMKYADTIVESNVAWLGTYINFELKNYQEARGFAKKYFVLKKNKKSEEYLDLLEVYVTIEERLLAQKEEEERLRLEQIRKEREQRRLDSLERVWINKANSLSLKVDDIQTFTKYGTAIIKKQGKFGLIDDVGNVLVEANRYAAIRSFDGYTLFLDKEKDARSIYAYDHKKKTGHLLPNPTEINTISTNFKEVMLPRANGKVVAYPNNSLEVFVYDINTKKVEKTLNEKDIFKQLRKADKIQKSNKEGKIKVDKEWYHFGGDLGAGVYPLFTDDYNIAGFLSSITGKIIPTATHNSVGSFYDGSYQYFKDGQVLWMNQNGSEVENPVNDFGSYSGETIIEKNADNSFRLLKNGTIILGEESLELLPAFLNKFSK